MKMIVEAGAELMADYRYRNEILGPVEIFGLERFEANCVVVKGQIKTRPLQQWSVARAFNARLKLKMDEAGFEMLLPQMQLHAAPSGRGQTENRHAADAPAQPELRVLKESP